MGLNYLNPEKHLQFHLKVTGQKQFIQMQVTMGWFQCIKCENYLKLLGTH